MSVIVKGMDMPKDCGHCRFAVDGWCYAYGRANIDALSTYERTNYCPLVPIPPHGRLIDADALCIPPEEINAKMAVVCAPTIIEAEGKE